MNRWLQLAQEPISNGKALPDTLTEPDKRGFCQVLSGCQVEKPEKETPSLPVEALPLRAPEPPTPSAPEPSRPQPDAFPYGRNFDGRPRTWTGKVVSLDEWRRLSDWDKHGSSGKVWNGITRQWEPMDGGAA